MKSKLYYYPGNANLAPHILLEEVAADYELVLIDRAQRAQKNPDYLQLNPNGTIPALISGDLVLFEAAAICLHIADHYPEAGLAPPLGSPARAHLYKWLFYLSNTVQPAYMAFRYPEQYTEPPPEPSSTPSGAPHLEAVQKAAAERATRAFQIIDRALGNTGPFLLGPSYSLCDAYLYMVAWWSKKLPSPPIHLPHIRACLSAVAARPATQRACTSEGIELYDPALLT